MCSVSKLSLRLGNNTEILACIGSVLVWWREYLEKFIIYAVRPFFAFQYDTFDIMVNNIVVFVRAGAGMCMCRCVCVYVCLALLWNRIFCEGAGHRRLGRNQQSQVPHQHPADGDHSSVLSAWMKLIFGKDCYDPPIAILDSDVSSLRWFNFGRVLVIAMTGYENQWLLCFHTLPFWFPFILCLFSLLP